MGCLGVFTSGLKRPVACMEKNEEVENEQEEEEDEKEENRGDGVEEDA